MKQFNGWNELHDIGMSILPTTWTPFSALKDKVPEHSNHPMPVFEDLVYFGKAECKIEPVIIDGQLRGSRTYYRKL